MIWGSNEYGNLGLGKFEEDSTEISSPDFSHDYSPFPHLIWDLWGSSKIESFSTGENHSAIVKDGEVFIWGDNRYG